MQEELNTLVTLYTSFLSWEELKTEIEEHNFVPVIVNERLRSRLQELGYPVWDGVVSR